MGSRVPNYGRKSARSTSQRNQSVSGCCHGYGKTIVKRMLWQYDSGVNSVHSVQKVLLIVKYGEVYSYWSV